MAAPAATRLSVPGRLFVAMLLIVVFEGAARKWLAGAATLPLIGLRDLIALYMVVRALTHGDLQRHPQWSIALLAWSCCVIAWGLLQLTLGQSNFAVLLIGLRFWLLYIAFAVAAAASMTEYDMRVAVRVLLATLVLMAPLAVLQHYSPPGAFVNRTPDTDEEDVFVVVLGVVRTTGTFTFTAGYTLFLALCAPFVLGAVEAPKRSNFQRLVTLAVFACLAAGALVSGSRGAVMTAAGMLGIYLVGSVVVSPARNKAVVLFTVLLVLLMVGALSMVFQGAVEATQQRFEVAGESEDLITRVLTTFLGEGWVYRRADWLGAGLGLGSNLAQYVQTGGRAVFALAETEPGRILLEGGLLGWLFIAIKYLLVLAAMGKSLLLTLRTRKLFTLMVWTAVSLALITWPTIGQLTAHAMFGVLLAFGLLAFKYPDFRLFE